MSTQYHTRFSLTVTIFIFCSAPLISFAQNYIDLFKINYGTIPSSSFDEVEGESEINLLNVSATIPIEINEKIAAITGVDYIQQGLELAPNTSRLTLNNINLKLGVNIKHTEKLSGTYVFLPRISSQNLHTEGNHLFFGGAAIFKYQKSERLQWLFGAYASTESLGVIATPIFGFYYKSEDDKLEVAANLPVSVDINYTLNKSTSIGLELSTPIKTYGIRPVSGFADTYVEAGNIEVGPYFEYRLLNNSLLLRAHAGYTAVSYESYNEGDELPFRFFAFEFGDDRSVLNPDFNGSVFFKVGLTYRYHLDK